MPPKKDTGTLAEAKARAQEQVKLRAAASAASKTAPRPATPVSRAPAPAPAPSPAPAPAPTPPPVPASAGKRKRAEAVPPPQVIDTRKKPRELEGDKGISSSKAGVGSASIPPPAPPALIAPRSAPAVEPSESEDEDEGEDFSEDDDDTDLHRISPRAPRAVPSPSFQPAGLSSHKQVSPALRRAPSPARPPQQLPSPLLAGQPLPVRAGAPPQAPPPPPPAPHSRAAPLVSTQAVREPGGGGGGALWPPPSDEPRDPPFEGLSHLRHREPRGPGAPPSDRRGAATSNTTSTGAASLTCCRRPPAFAAISWPVTVALSALGLSALLLAAWWASAAFFASTPGAISAAVVHEMRLAAGEAACSASGGNQRVLPIAVVVERLRAAGSTTAAAALDRAAVGLIDAATHNSLETGGVNLTSDKTLRLDAAIPVLKPWVCWAEEDVLAPVAAAAWAGAEWGANAAWAGTIWGVSSLVAAALARPDVALAVLAVLAIALWRWNVRARDLVVAAMFDCALRELEALAGRAVPLAQLRPHVLDKLYAGPYSVMALRAARYWPRVETRLKGDSRVHIDVAAETAAGHVQPVATWVSPLRRAPPGASGAPRGGWTPPAQPAPWMGPPASSPAAFVRR